MPLSLHTCSASTLMSLGCRKSWDVRIAGWVGMCYGKAKDRVFIEKWSKKKLDRYASRHSMWCLGDFVVITFLVFASMGLGGCSAFYF